MFKQSFIHNLSLFNNNNYLYKLYQIRPNFTNSNLLYKFSLNNKKFLSYQLENNNENLKIDNDNDNNSNNNNNSNHNENNYNNIFISNDSSFLKLSSYYTQNLSTLKDKIKNEDFSKTINHFKSLVELNENFNQLPKSGSFVHFNSINNNEYLENNFGIVLNDLNFSLSNNSIFKILIPNGEIIEIDSNDVLFVIPNFINHDLMKKYLLNNEVLPIKHLIHLTYTLNIFLLYSIKISNLLLSKDLIRTIYLKSSFINYQSSLNLFHFSLDLFNISKSLRNNLNLNLNPLGTHALIFSCHYLIYNDPIHFRFLINKKFSIFNILNPLNQVTTNYFKNPILLSENLEKIYVQPNNLIKKSYFDILKKSNDFQIYNILKIDENFKRLILLIKYSIINPNKKLLNKLKYILPITSNLNSKILFNFLVDIGIYDKDSNSLLSSGIYGLNMYGPTDLSLPVKNLNDLQYSFNKDLRLEKLPKYLQRYRPFKHLNDDKFNKIDFFNNKFVNNNFSNSFLKIIQDSKLKIWSKHKSKNRKTLYKLTETIAFSVEQESLTNYQFNFFIPIPNQSPNENITIQEPIQLFNNLKSFPKLFNFNHTLRINQPCIKLTINHNLIDSNSLTSPNIKVGLDMFKKIEIIDEDWFKNRNASNLKGSKKKMDCWLALNKLLNLLIEKEKSRIKLGYLKITDDSNNFLNKIIEHNTLSNEESIQIKDKLWIIKNLKLLIDENLSRFCLSKGINIVNRCMNENIKNSIDYKIFKKFKIFKWYANSYETFNFQLSSTFNDLTAYVGCLSFLGESKYFFNITHHHKDNKGNNRNHNHQYLPLGLKYYSSFTSLEFMETHLNQWQLFRYLLIESIGIIEDNNNINWDPNKLDKVTNEHYIKCLSQSEGYIELMNRYNRFNILKTIEKDISGGTNIIKDNKNKYSFMRCIITKITRDKIIGYWCENDIEVEIKIDINKEYSKNKVTIGDRLICSEIVEVDPFNDILVVK